jgi:hypothetical protein
MPWTAVPQAAAASFCDVPSSAPYYEAVTQLSNRGIINGYDNGCFGPNDTTLRAQMAALIARTVGWDSENHGNPFPDKGTVDDNLWRNVGTLAYYDVARGYQDGTYQPTGEVLYAQTVSFITRALVRVGYWQQLPDNPAIYPEVPASSGHRADIVTYVAYAGTLPGLPSTPQGFYGYAAPATRAWFAMTLWQAIGPPVSAPESPAAAQFKSQATTIINGVYPLLREVLQACPSANPLVCQSLYDQSTRKYAQVQYDILNLAGGSFPSQCGPLFTRVMAILRLGKEALDAPYPEDRNGWIVRGEAITRAQFAGDQAAYAQYVMANEPGDCR